MGAPGERLVVGGTARPRAGAFHVLRGTVGGLTSSHNRFFSQQSSGVAGTAAAGDLFGSAMPD